MSKQLNRLARLPTVVLCTAFLASSLTGCDTLLTTGFIVNPSESPATATTAVVASDEVNVVEHILQSLAEAHDFKRVQESSRREAIVVYEKDDGLTELGFWAYTRGASIVIGLREWSHGEQFTGYRRIRRELLNQLEQAFPDRVHVQDTIPM